MFKSGKIHQRCDDEVVIMDKKTNVRITSSLKENIDLFKKILSNNDTIIYRQIENRKNTDF